MKGILAHDKCRHTILTIDHTSKHILRTEVLSAITSKHLTFHLREKASLELNTTLHTELISQSLLIVCHAHTFLHTLEEFIYKSRVATSLHEIFFDLLRGRRLWKTHRVRQAVNFVFQIASSSRLFATTASTEECCSSHEGAKKYFFILLFYYYLGEKFFTLYPCILSNSRSIRIVG